MLDLRNLPEEIEIEADVCIVGAGAAGIAIARELIGSPLRVCLVESGGLELEPDTQSLYTGEVAGIGGPERNRWAPLDTLRMRRFGGNTMHWGGRCIALSDIDFRKRPWVPYSGWPITKRDLDPYYQRAHTVCEIGPYEHNVGLWKDRGGQPLKFLPGTLVNGWSQWSPPTRFGAVYLSELKQASNIKILLHANVTELVTNELASIVRHVNIMTTAGKGGRVRAKHFILSCGAIENVRILLLSNSVAHAGLGNQHDQVGRFLLQHPLFPSATLFLNRPESKFLHIYQGHRKSRSDLRFRERTVMVSPHIALSERLQERQQVLNCFTEYASTSNEESVWAAKEIGRDLLFGAICLSRRGRRPTVREFIERARIPDELGSKLWSIIKGPGDLIRLASRKLSERHFGAYPRILTCFVIIEQAPNPDSRITLAKGCDSLGQRKVRVEWQMTELDKRSIEVTTKAVANELERLNVARVQPAAWLSDEHQDWKLKTHFVGGHHVGGTRMSTEPRHGVVDAQCRVHGLDNLYIAGGSVFPTEGYANPLLTIVALALRLADHLKTL